MTTTCLVWHRYVSLVMTREMRLTRYDNVITFLYMTAVVSEGRRYYKAMYSRCAVCFERHFVEPTDYKRKNRGMNKIN